MAGGACCLASLRQSTPRKVSLASACIYLLGLGHAVSAAAFLAGAIIGNPHAVLMGPTGFRVYCGAMAGIWGLLGVVFVRAGLRWRLAVRDQALRPPPLDGAQASLLRGE